MTIDFCMAGDKLAVAYSADGSLHSPAHLKVASPDAGVSLLAEECVAIDVVGAVTPASAPPEHHAFCRVSVQRCSPRWLVVVRLWARRSGVERHVARRDVMVLAAWRATASSAARIAAPTAIAEEVRTERRTCLAAGTACPRRARGWC